MSRRVLLTSATIALLLGLLFLAPGFPPVRKALLDRVVVALGNAGVHLTYGSAEGNAWRRLALSGVALEGHGALVNIDQLQLAYHLPSLLGGELPLDVAARGVRGNIDLSGIESLIDQAWGTGSSRASLNVRVVLREVELEDVALTAANAPFTLPDATLSDIHVAPEPGGLRLGARLITPDGELAAEGRLAVPSYDLSGTVTHVDIAIARQWWQGAVSGTATGPFSLRRGQFNADLTITNGAVHQSGIDVTGISGTAVMRYPRITADLQGFGLGGPVSASGTVDIAAQNYTIEGNAAGDLAEVVSWLADFYDLTDLPVGAAGQAQAQAKVSGWKLPRIEGVATASGDIGGVPLNGLSATLDMVPQGAIRLGANAQLGGGAVTASIAPSSAGNRLLINGASISLDTLEVAGVAPGGVVQSMRAQVELTPTAEGTLALTWNGEFLDYSAVVEVDGRVDADGLQAFMSAVASPESGPAIAATGAVVYADDFIDAGVSVTDLPVPGLTRPVRLGVTAQGVPSDLSLTLTIGDDLPVTLEVAVLQPGGALHGSDVIDLRGRATGTLAGGELKDISGAFGPILVSGTVNLAPLEADLSLTTEPVTVRVGSQTQAPTSAQPADTDDAASAGSAGSPTPPTGSNVRATLTVQGGQLRYVDGHLAVQAQAAVSDATAGSAVVVDLQELDVGFGYWTNQAQQQLSGEGDITDASASSRWQLDLLADNGVVAFSLGSGSTPFTLGASGLPVYVGSSPRPTLLTASLSPAANATYVLTADVHPASSVAGMNLTNGATFVGVIDPARRGLFLDGAIGALPASAEIDWSTTAVEVRADLEGGAESGSGVTATLTPTSGEWSLRGDYLLAPLLTELGLNGLQPEFRGQLSYSGSTGYSGSGVLTLLQPLAATLQLTGAAAELHLALQSEVGGVPVEGVGTIDQPLLQSVVAALAADGSGAPTLLVDLGPLRNLTLDIQGLRGAGEVSAQAFGPISVGPVPWSLDFGWASTAGFLEAGGEVLNVALLDGRVTATGSLGADIEYGGSRYSLSLWAGDSPGDQLSATNLDTVRVGAALTPLSGGGPLATVRGPLSALEFQLGARLEELAAALPDGYLPTGALSASATVNVLAGPTYQGQLTLAPGPAATAASDAFGAQPVDGLEATFTGVGGNFSLQVASEGLSVSHAPATALTDGRLTLTAEQADLSRFFPAGMSGVLDGSLSYGAAGWRGQLRTRVRADRVSGTPSAEVEGSGNGVNENLFDATATLTGQFSTLQLMLDGGGAGLSSFEASGTLLPEQDISGSFTLLGGEVTGRLGWQDTVSATVISQQQTVGDWLTVPAMRAELNADLKTGTVTLKTPDLAHPEARTEVGQAVIDLALVGGQVSGTFSLPADLQSAELVVNAVVSGGLANPDVTAMLHLAGTGSSEEALATVRASPSAGAELSAAVSAEHLARLLPTAAQPALDYLGPTSTVEARIEPSGEWRARVSAPVSAELTATGNELSLELEARGQGATYEGALHLVGLAEADSTYLAGVPFTGAGAAANASLDLGNVEWQQLGAALGLQLDVHGTGLLSVGTSPFSTSLTLDLAGTVASNVVRLRGTAPDDLTLSVVGDAVQLEGQLNWSTTVTDGGTAQLEGRLLDRPVNLFLDVGQGLASGRLDLQAVGATLTAQLSTQAETADQGAVRLVAVSADVPQGSWARYGASGHALIAITGVTAELQELTAAVVGLLSEPVDVQLAGSVSPHLDLSGIVSSARLSEPAQLTVTTGANELSLSAISAKLDWRDLSATVAYPDGPLVALSGGASSQDLGHLLGLSDAVPTELVSQVVALGPRLGPLDLEWSAGAGWRGSFRGEADAPWAAANEPIGIIGNGESGSLRVLARSRSGSDYLEVALLVPPDPWSDAPLVGSVNLDVTTSQMLPDLGIPVRLRSTSDIGGTLLAPTLAGTLHLGGALEGQGVLSFARGVGQLDVTGPELAVRASYAQGEAFAEAQLRELSMDQWLPQVSAARLSLDARLAGQHLTVTSLRLEAPSSLVTGGASLRLVADEGQGTRFTAALDASLDLTDLNLGTNLTGQVRGPVIISSSSLTNLSTAAVIANLAALRVGTPSLDWSVSGNLSVGGTVGDPAISTELYGDGNLRGTLNVNAQPTSRVYELTSTLAAGQLATDLRIELGNGSTTATGTVRYGDGLFVVDRQSGLGAQPDLTVTGAGRFAGLSALISGDLSSVTLGGSLEALNPGLEGHMHLTADSRARNWLSGSVTGVKLMGRELAPIDITATTAGATIVVQSSELRATADPVGLAWTLAVNALALGSGPTAPELTVWATGVGAAGSLNAGLKGSEFELAAEIRHNANTTVLLEGSAYGGELFVTGVRNSGSNAWTGGGTFAGAHAFGFDVAAQATILGVGLIPQVVLATNAEGGLSITGNASVGVDGVTIDQLVRGEPLEQAVRVQGRILPGNDLTLSTLELPVGASLTAAAAERATTSSVRLTGGSSAVAAGQGSLRATGRFLLSAGPVDVELSGAGGQPHMAVSVSSLPRLRAAADLQAADLIRLVQGVFGNGLTLHGQDAIRGEVTLNPDSMSLDLVALGVELAGVDLEATGRVGIDTADVTGRLSVKTDLPVAERETGYVFPWQLTAASGLWRLDSSGPHGEFHGTYGADAGELNLNTDLTLSDGRIFGALGLQPGGLTGTLAISDVTLLSPELGALTIDVEATVADGSVELGSVVNSEAGRVQLDGSWGLGNLLPQSVARDAPTGGRIEARLRSLELSGIPYVADHLPEVSGEINGVAQLRDGFVFGQFVAQQIAVGDLTTPLQLNVSGRPNDLALDLQLRGAIGRADLHEGNMAGILRFERFPLTLLSTAVVGPSDFTADVTGVMRFDGPLSSPLQGYLRVATEEVRLERMGVPTTGNVTITFEQGEVVVDRAEFEGVGSWNASGVLRQELFDFSLQAHQADFTPLLGLVPAFARLGVEAVGSFDLSVKGSALDPSISLSSPDLEVEVSGSRYRLENTAFALEGVGLTVSSLVHGLRPVTGALDVKGGALLALYPFSLANAELDLTGSAGLGTFGTLTDVQGMLRQQADGTPTIDITGIMGQRPLTVRGTLTPLNLQATGSGVTMSMPGLLIDRAVVDANVGLVTVPGGVALSGTIVADEVILDPAARSRVRTEAEADEVSATSADDPVATAEQPEPQLTDEALPNVEALAPAPAPPERSGGLASLHFDDLAIRAPGRVTLTTNVGSFEAGLDLTLSGTGAEPRLAGNASAIRGNLRFGGRDFTIDRAVATFTPNRGVYPELDVVAHSEFDKQRIMSSAPNVSFAAPREGNSFDVQLAFFGPVEPTEDGGFRFDIQPVLSSNALIEVQGQAVGATAARPFTEAELMALITLGRFELNAELVGAGGLGEAVATGALDTAIDLLVVSGLESALREALGFDVVEIRTSSLSSLLDESGQPFGVSLRVGGYLHPELFASYRIGTYDGGDPEFSVTNEVLLRYALGPLDLDVIARVDFPTAGTQGQPRPEIGVLLGYQFSPGFGIDGGVTLGAARSRIEFGVTIRW